MDIKTLIQWWLLDRYRTRRECAALRKSLREMRQANWSLQEKLFVANRDRLDAQAKLEQMSAMWVDEGTKWREQLDRVVVWLGRVACGFGPGDTVPKQEQVAVDTVYTGKVHPKDMVQAIIRRAAANGPTS